MHPHRIAFVYGTPLGVGGLGVQAGNALRALALGGATVHAIGPAPAASYAAPANVRWHTSPMGSSIFEWRPLRRYAGLQQFQRDRRIGGFAAKELAAIKPDFCYAFTQVALETLAWASVHRVPSVLESPNGHIDRFRQVYLDEGHSCCGSAVFRGHPTTGMVKRVKAEYAAAAHIRVSSEWSRRSLADAGVEAPISVVQQPVDLDRYNAPVRTAGAGPLRVCFVGSLDLRKGFIYLLRAARGLGSDIHLELVGATGDRCSAATLRHESTGMEVVVQPGDPRAALARAELLVLPTLEDGSPFAAAEAMASGLPVVTTTATGAAEWIRNDVTGWVVGPRSSDALAAVLARALEQRHRLPEMGRQARLDTEARVGDCDRAFTEWMAQL